MFLLNQFEDQQIKNNGLNLQGFYRHVEEA